MSLHATPLLYLNMGGEMLYVLRQRLKAQRVDVDKTVQVLDDVTASLLNPKTLSSVFTEALITSVTSLRPTLECVVLSSIMKLDTGSMDKLFDLMIMMLKYQLTAATGPLEVILLTLNHTDAMRDMVSNLTAQECIGLVHQMIIDFYCNLTFEEVWQARNECLKELEPYCVRVSILLKLGLQNDDASFNLSPQKYDERYEQYRDKLCNIKIKDADLERHGGSFYLIGNRGTLLGRNIYSSIHYTNEKMDSKQSELNFVKHCGSKAELGMLTIQLGTQETYERPISLNLFLNEENTVCNKNNENNTEINKSEVEEQDNTNLDTKNKGTTLNEVYRSKLDNVYAEFFEDEQVEINKNMNLLELLDETK